MSPRMSILVFSLILSFGGAAAALPPGSVDCRDGTHCPKNHFCSKPDGSDHTVCAEQARSLPVCNPCPDDQMCIENESTDQATCAPVVDCPTACSGKDQGCVTYDGDQGACLSKSVPNGNGAVACGDGNSSTCATGYFCYMDDDDEEDAQMLCAPHPADDILCVDGCLRGGCYRGPQPGQIACIKPRLCETHCANYTGHEFCYRLKSTMDDGTCFQYSENNS